MSERAQLAWLARRVGGFGLAPGQLDAWEAKGVATVLDELTDPDAHGVEPSPNPFEGLPTRRQKGREVLRDAITGWLGVAISGPRPLETWMQFFWHDYFAVSARVVRVPGLMYDHFNLMRDAGLGNFADLLRQMTTDAAMLVFLDGASSTGEAPNENYGRELLELYSVGVGNFSEDDVQAAAVALTGWVVRRRFGGAVVFSERRHSDTPQTLLGVPGVNDADTVIDAVVGHPATAERVTTLLANAILGTGVDPGVLARRAQAFAGDLELRSLVRGLLEDGLDGAGTEVIVGPVSWYVAAMKATRAQPQFRRIAQAMRAAGQIPLLPPNVGGFPPPLSYLSTSATVARFNAASAIAETADATTPAWMAAQSGDVVALGEAFGLPGGFTSTTTAAISSLEQPVDRLAAALASPELIVGERLEQA